MEMYRVLDHFFIVIHSCLVLFNLSGWAFKRTRRIHLMIISVTLFSWFGLGLFYGWGFCPLTQWHWQVKYQLGEILLPDSYIKYYADKLTGLSWEPLVVDSAVLILGLLSFVLSCWLNWLEIKQNRQKKAV